MRFHLQRRQQGPAIIVVALIDILIVLVIFLMVTTTFKQRPALRVALPESSQARREGSSESVPLVVSIEREGNLRLGPDAKPVTLEVLRQELVHAVLRNSDLKVDIYSDSNSTVGQLVRVMDAVKGANVKTFGLRTRDGERNHQPSADR